MGCHDIALIDARFTIVRASVIIFQQSDTLDVAGKTDDRFHRISVYHTLRTSSAK
ncbi:hypothetical protein D3C83_129880 [compost metagenome]